MFPSKALAKKQLHPAQHQVPWHEGESKTQYSSAAWMQMQEPLFKKTCDAAQILERLAQACQSRWDQWARRCLARLQPVKYTAVVCR